jgi:predicted translin family RNA/ssDNA-binding protein
MKYLDKQYLKKMHANLHNYASIRREIIKYAGDAQHLAKRAIFEIHADNFKEAEKKLFESKKLLSDLAKKYKASKIKTEGVYAEGIEEFVEAYIFYNLIINGRVGAISGVEINDESYLSGLCDVPGELYRYAIKAATAGNYVLAQKCNDMAKEIVGELIEFHFTKYLRTKYDQAKQALRKLEIVVYELSLKK